MMSQGGLGSRREAQGVLDCAYAPLRLQGVPSLTGAQRPEEVRAIAVSTGWFDVIGVEPAMGRVFSAEEDVPGEDDVVVLSHGLWQRLGADPDIIGSKIQLSETLATVVGEVVKIRLENLA